MVNKHLRLLFIAVISQFFLTGCPVKNESLLLSPKKTCADTDTCPQIQTSVPGSISIQSDADTYQMNVEQSDMIEIAGRCSDLGIKRNRIYVQAFEGEDTSVNPYLDNTVSIQCVSSSVPANNGSRCLFLTEGKGIIDGTNEYPQCFNGRFSFSVKLGKILRTDPNGPANNEATNAIKNYLVRFKIRTEDGAPTESQWSQAIVKRSISKPGVITNTNWQQKRCEVKIAAFKNTPTTAVAYSAYVIRNFKIGGDTPQARVSNDSGGAPDYLVGKFLSYPLNDDGFQVTNYFHTNLIPGVSYKIKVLAEDCKYTYTLSSGFTNSCGGGSFTENSGYTSESVCRVVASADRSGGNATAPTVCTGGVPYTGAGAQTQYCNMLVKSEIQPNLGAGYSIEWGVVKNATAWDPDFNNVAGEIQTCGQGVAMGTKAGCWTRQYYGSSSNPAEFKFEAQRYPAQSCDAFANNFAGTYLIAYRFVYFDGTKEYKGDWSGAAPCPL